MQCPDYAFTRENLARFEAADAQFHPKSYALADIRSSLDGSACSPVTLDGVARGAQGVCTDLGIPSSSAKLLAAGGDSPFELLPEAHDDRSRAPEWQVLATRLQKQLADQQFDGVVDGCGLAGAPAWRSMYYVHKVPLIGFASTLEYAVLYLVRAAHLRSQLVFGRESARGWTSAWFCAEERTLSCYFNTSSCCGRLTHAAGGVPIELSRRRNPVSIGLPGFNHFGSAFVSAQMAHFLCALQPLAGPLPAPLACRPSRVQRRLTRARAPRVQF